MAAPGHDGRSADGPWRPADAWGQAPAGPQQPAGHDAFPPPYDPYRAGPAVPQAARPEPFGLLPAQGSEPWPPPAPRSRRSPARWIGAGSLVLVLGVVGGFAGGLLQDELSDGSGGTYPGVSLPSPSAGSTQRAAGSVAGIAAAALPSVVALQVQGSQGSGTGSGFVLDAPTDGGSFVLTNNHVVAGAATDGIVVVFQDGQQARGRVVGADSSYDLAVVRVDRTGLRALPFGDSSSVVVGDPVVAVGAPLGLQGTVTEGIVSALNRPVTAGSPRTRPPTSRPSRPTPRSTRGTPAGRCSTRPAR